MDIVFILDVYGLTFKNVSKVSPTLSNPYCQKKTKLKMIIAYISEVICNETVTCFE